MVYRTLLMLCLALPAASEGRGQWGDPLGWEPLELSGGNGVVFTLAGLGASLLLSDAPDSTTASPDRPWAGARFVVGHAGYYQSVHEARTDVFTGHLGMGTFLRRWLAVGVEVHATRLRDARLGTAGVGGMPFVRWHLYPGRQWTVFFEYGAGLIFTLDDFPPGGTKVNFTPTYGAGLAYHLFGRVHLLAGVRHFHISNGSVIAGRGRNPGFDSNGFYVGQLFTF